MPKRIIDLSYELGNTQNEAPNSNFAKPSAWGFQPLPPHPLRLPRLSGESNFIRRGLNPNPRPFPSPGEGMQPLASARSVTKVSATHQRVAGRFPTQQSCDCLCSLRSPKSDAASPIPVHSRSFLFIPIIPDNPNVVYQGDGESDTRTPNGLLDGHARYGECRYQLMEYDMPSALSRNCMSI